MEPKSPSTAADKPKNITIPLSLAGQSDINRVLRELGKIDEFFMSASVRKSGTSNQPPRVTRALSTLAQENRLNLLQEKDRVFLKQQLEDIAKNAPNVHISFAAEPTPKILERIISWFRENIHPNTLVVVGLQPNIAAGLVVRTPNKIFDLSMQSYLKSQEDYLVKLIAEVANA
ncbi:MAG TPA: F0F1 ATP synthase subunit delta [Candidatus Saccharimonadales bacterium]|nr:F0F1 ATP synthase subunit delta [Candidatus Saccharimonadales bacterium]